MSGLVSPATKLTMIIVRLTLCYLLKRSLLCLLHLHCHPASATRTLLSMLSTLVNCGILSSIPVECILFREIIARADVVGCPNRLLSCWTLLLPQGCSSITMCHVATVDMLSHWPVLCLLTDSKAASRPTLLNIHIEQVLYLFWVLNVGGAGAVRFLGLTCYWVNRRLRHTIDAHVWHTTAVLLQIHTAISPLGHWCLSLVLPLWWR